MSSYIGKININNTEYPIAQSLFGTCNTTANTATKVVTCADFDTLISGIVINVYFTYANTESSISLNVNSTGNKIVYVDNNSSILWDAGATKSFVYYNNQWRLINPTSVGTTYSAATTAAAGLMSATDKTKLDGLTGQYVPIQVTGWMSTSAINSSGDGLNLSTSSTWSGVDQILDFQQGQYPKITLSNIFNAIDEASIQMGRSDRDTYISALVNYTGSGSCVGQSGVKISSDGINLQSNNIKLEAGDSSSSTAPYSLIEAKLVGDTADVINLYSNKGGINIFGGQGVSIGSRTTSGVIISELQDPTNPQDAVNKRYVDNSIASIPASTYAAGSGLSLSDTTFNHTNSITASSVGSSVATSGATLDIPYAKYDAQGHITAKGTHVHTIGSLAASAITSGTFATARIPNLPTSIITSGTFATARIPNLPTSIITSGTFSTARLPVSTSVGNNNNLPTGAAIQTYVTGLGYEANQNAFSNVVVGSSTVAADQKTDTLTLAGAGSVTLSANTSTDTITITGTDTTYGSATTAAAGLMSATDKQALGKWNDVELEHAGMKSMSNCYIPWLSNVNSTLAQLCPARDTPEAYAIARYSQPGYLIANTPATSTSSSVVATTQFVHNAIAASISEGILKGIRINSSDSYVSSLSSNIYLITHNQGFAENFTSTVMVKDSSSSYFYQAINDDGVSLVYTNGKIRYDIFDIQENQFKIEFSSVPYQFSILINTNYDSLSLVDVDSTSTLLSI